MAEMDTDDAAPSAESGHRAGSKDGAQRWSRRQRLGAMIAAGAILVGGGITAVVIGRGTSPEPTPSPTPMGIDVTTQPELIGDWEVDADGVALPGRLTWHPVYPERKALPADIWERDLSGWALGVYEVSIYGARGGIPETAPPIIALGSPDGELYQVLELPQEHDLEIVQWTGGDTAIVALWPDGLYASMRDPRGPVEVSTPEYRVLDLRTGATAASAIDTLGDGFKRFVGWSSDGDEIWTIGSDYLYDDQRRTRQDESTAVIAWSDAEQARTLYERAGTLSPGWVMLSPDGTRLLLPEYADTVAGEPYRILDIASGETMAIPAVAPFRFKDPKLYAECRPAGWHDDASFYVWCAKEYEVQAIWRVDAADGELIEQLFARWQLDSGALDWHVAPMLEGVYLGGRSTEKHRDCFSTMFVEKGHITDIGYPVPHPSMADQAHTWRLTASSADGYYLESVASCLTGTIGELVFLDAETREISPVLPALLRLFDPDIDGNPEHGFGLISVAVAP